LDAREVGGLWLLREMPDFPAGVPEDERLDYLKAIMACARGDGVLAPAERSRVIGYGAACGATLATVDALEAYGADEDVAAILERSMPVAESWGCVAAYDAIRASAADGDYDDGAGAAVRREAATLGVGDDVVGQLEALHEAEWDLKRRRIALVCGEAVANQERAVPSGTET
jgi:hypothetical protein